MLLSVVRRKEYQNVRGGVETTSIIVEKAGPSEYVKCPTGFDSKITRLFQAPTTLQ
jgi:hypothetical protein